MQIFIPSSGCNFVDVNRHRLYRVTIRPSRMSEKLISKHMH